MTETLLYGDSSLDDKSNILTLNATTDFFFVTKRFEVNPLYILYILVKFIVLFFLLLFFFIPRHIIADI